MKIDSGEDGTALILRTAVGAMKYNNNYTLHENQTHAIYLLAGDDRSEL